jgi:phosphopantetheine adenylyltransferase
MWEAKYHAKSSLPKKDGQFSLFIGRWQPLHEGHKQLFNQVIEEGGKVCIAIREGEVNEKNPYSPREVMMNICKEMEQHVNSGKVKVIIIPDICSVEFGRGVGYDIIERIPPQEIAEISATKIREKLKNASTES